MSSQPALAWQRGQGAQPCAFFSTRPIHIEDRGFVLILLSMNISTYLELKRRKMEHADLAYEIQKVC